MDSEDALDIMHAPLHKRLDAEIAMWRALSHESMGSSADYSDDSTNVSSPCAIFDEEVSGSSFEHLAQKHSELLWSEASSDAGSSSVGENVFDGESFAIDAYYEEDDYQSELILLDLSASNLDSIPSSILCIPDAPINLAVLDLSHNVFDPNEDYLVESLLLPHLKTLSLDSCGLTTLRPLFQHLNAPILQTLDVSGHRLTGPVPRFRHYWPMIENVSAAAGWFDTLDVSSIVDLKILDLRNNLITRESILKITTASEESDPTVLL